jgi:hypothetical protein
MDRRGNRCQTQVIGRDGTYRCATAAYALFSGNEYDQLVPAGTRAATMKLGLVQGRPLAAGAELVDSLRTARPRLVAE